MGQRVALEVRERERYEQYKVQKYEQKECSWNVKEKNIYIDLYNRQKSPLPSNCSCNGAESLPCRASCRPSRVFAWPAGEPNVACRERGSRQVDGQLFLNVSRFHAATLALLQTSVILYWAGNGENFYHGKTPTRNMQNLPTDIEHNHY